MVLRGRPAVIAVLAGLGIAGCSGSLWPSLEGGDPTGSDTAATSAATSSAYGDNAAPTPTVAAGPPTGTYVGSKIAGLRSELAGLQQRSSANGAEFQRLSDQLATTSDRYRGTVAAIRSRLQAGTTAGNPELTTELYGAEGDLNAMTDAVGAMNDLATAASADAAFATYLGQSVRASYDLSGAVDEDHRQLAVLEDDVTNSALAIDGLQGDLSREIRRYSDQIAVERSNLNVLAAGVRNGELYGESLANRIAAPARAVSSTRTGDYARRQPLVVTRFDQETVPSRAAVYNAVRAVLDRDPGAAFDVVGVAVDRGDTARLGLDSTRARRHADDVYRSLGDFGLPPVRIGTDIRSSSSVATNEVRIYVR